MLQAARFVAPYAANYVMQGTWEWYQRGKKRARRFGPASAVENVGGGGQQLSYSKMKHGRKVKRRELLMRILAAKLNVVQHRWQNVTNSASGAGAFTLEYYYDFNAGQTTPSTLPVVLFDLTGAQQQFIGGNATFASVASRLYRNRSTNNFYTDTVPGRNNEDDGNIWPWILERNSGLTNTKEYSEALIEDVHIKLLLYGARKYPSRVTVSIVSFTEGFTPSAYVCGPAIANTPVLDESEPSPLLANNDESLNDWNAMWMNHTAPLIGNPINVRPAVTRQLMKVHKSKVYSFQPKLSTELDITGDQVSVNFNYKMNKRVDYTRASPSAAAVTVGEEINPNEWPVYTDNELSVHARPEQRMFLMISGMTALNTYGVVTGPVDYAPSFDICIRRKISAIDV